MSTEQYNQDQSFLDNNYHQNLQTNYIFRARNLQEVDTEWVDNDNGKTLKISLEGLQHEHEEGFQYQEPKENIQPEPEVEEVHEVEEVEEVNEVKETENVEDIKEVEKVKEIENVQDVNDKFQGKFIYHCINN